jgi:adenylate cyclase
MWVQFRLRIGALPAGRVIWGLVILFSIWVLLDVFVVHLSGGLSRNSYDSMVRNRIFTPAVDPRIVVVDIDEASLSRMGQQFGRWPWPRDTLATVLEHIEAQQPAAVVWDILFSDADRLSPGGDAAFDAAARVSAHSVFSIVRLPQMNDKDSRVSRQALPGLWLPHSDPSVTNVALIPPALPAVASARLGYNNGYVDADGVLRRYRFVERLSDGSAIQSLPIAVLAAMNRGSAEEFLEGTKGRWDDKDPLMVWPSRADAYPHVSFADVFAQAEGDQPLSTVPSFSGKVVIMGATAPSLHDIHPTPLSNMQAGVDSLAVAIDNALNHRKLGELPQSVQAALAIALCVGLAMWVKLKGASSLAPALLALPAALVALSYASLNGLPVFLDLQASASLALLFLSVLGFWSSLRRDYWCTPPERGALMLLPLRRESPWDQDALDKLINVLEEKAPDFRVLVSDVNLRWPATLRWPELAHTAAIVGPAGVKVSDGTAQILTQLLRAGGIHCGLWREIALQDPSQADGVAQRRKQLVRAALAAWVECQDPAMAAEHQPHREGGTNENSTHL